ALPAIASTKALPVLAWLVALLIAHSPSLGGADDQRSGSSGGAALVRPLDGRASTAPPPPPVLSRVSGDGLRRPAVTLLDRQRRRSGERVIVDGDRRARARGRRGRGDGEGRALLARRDRDRVRIR